MVYQWKDGAHKAGNAQHVGERLESIRVANGGGLAPRDIVVDAREVGSPLHRYFEWRDNVAALKYRETQARELIRSVVVAYDEKPDALVPAFVCVAQGDDEFKPYQSTRVALTQPESRDYVLARALRELDAWKKKYRHLSELSDVLNCLEHAPTLFEAAEAA